MRAALCFYGGNFCCCGTSKFPDLRASLLLNPAQQRVQSHPALPDSACVSCLSYHVPPDIYSSLCPARDPSQLAVTVFVNVTLEGCYCGED